MLRFDSPLQMARDGSAQHDRRGGFFLRKVRSERMRGLPGNSQQEMLICTYSCAVRCRRRCRLDACRGPAWPTTPLTCLPAQPAPASPREPGRRQDNYGTDACRGASCNGATVCPAALAAAGRAPVDRGSGGPGDHRPFGACQFPRIGACAGGLDLLSLRIVQVAEKGT
jgi:hypothetical protein